MALRNALPEVEKAVKDENETNPFAVNTVEKYGTATSLNEDSLSKEDSDINEEFDRLHKYYARAKKLTNQKHIWLINDVIKGFTTAFGYPLDEEEHENLLNDMRSVNDLLSGAEDFKNSKDGKGNFSQSAKNVFETRLDSVTSRAEKNLSSKRDVLIKVGVAMSILALAAAVGVVIAASFVVIPAIPFIVAACLAVSVGLLAASAAGHYHQSNYTLFGQNLKNHGLMADVVIGAADVLESKEPNYLNP